MAAKKSTATGKRGRDAGTGQFVSQAQVRQRPGKTINETVKRGKKK